MAWYTGVTGALRRIYHRLLNNRVIITKEGDWPDIISSSVEYFIDGEVVMTSREIEIPADGINIKGYNLGLSILSCASDNYTMFKSAVGGSGNVFGLDYTIRVTGTNSKVYDLTSVTGNEAFEFTNINYENCTSLGEITNYRQGLENGTGRFGGTPELTLSGTWNGYRVTTTIVRGLSDITAIFKAGGAFTLDGRFITDINCDLPTNGALLDFTPSNFVNDETLVIQGALITRNGVQDASDTTLIPNITQDSIKSNWRSNTGIPNTNKYIKMVSTAEVETVITDTDTYYPLLGTFTVEDSTHFDMPSNGEPRLLTGTGDYPVNGVVIVRGVGNDVLDIRVTKSTDDGVTFPDIVNHVPSVINNIVGPRDVAIVNINFIARNMNKNDRLRLEVEMKEGSTNNVTMEVGSYLIVGGV